MGLHSLPMSPKRDARLIWVKNIHFCNVVLSRLVAVNRHYHRLAYYILRFGHKMLSVVCLLRLSLPGHHRVTDEALLAETTYYNPSAFLLEMILLP